MMFMYWVQFSALDCNQWEELEDEITFLVKAQSLPHIPLASSMNVTSSVFLNMRLRP